MLLQVKTDILIKRYKKMRNYKEIIEALIQEVAFVTPRLQKLTFDLIKLVETDQIESFGFRSTKDDLAGNNPIRVSVSVKSHKDYVILGLFDKLDEFPKSKQILSEKSFPKLEEINGYLSFANTHLLKDLPPIEATTYYSINAANKLGAFKQSPVEHLLPAFMKEELAPVKTNKIK